jgi:hypothetical protein
MIRSTILAVVLGVGAGTTATADDSPFPPPPPRVPQPVGVEGRWLMSGDPRQPCFIEADGRGFLVLTNEKGEQSRGRLLPGGRVMADDWGALIGDLRGDEIFWRNGDRWAR